MPKLAGGPYPYHDLYNQFGSGISSIVLAPLQNPKVFFGTLFTKSRFVFFFWMLAPLGFIPLLNPKTFIAAVPPFAVLFLTNSDFRVSLSFHYSIEETIGLFWAFPRGVIFLEHYLATRRAPELAAPLWILFFGLAAMGRSELFRPRFFAPNAHHEWLSAEFLPALNPEATVSATDSLVSHLTDRYWARNPLNQVISSYSLQYPTARQNPLAGQLVQCVIEDTSLRNYGMDAEGAREFYPKLKAQAYSEVYHCGSVRVWSQASNKAPCLLRPAPCVE